MTVPLLPYTAPDGTEVLIAWLTPLGETRDERPSGAVLPFRQVHRLGGPFDGLVDHGLYSVSTFSDDSADASTQADLTHRRILLLGPSRQFSYVPQAKVTLSSGLVVQADGVQVMEGPHEVNYGEGAGHLASAPYSRYVATYVIPMRIIRAT
jgi:hypothetical protein